jgi:hypothetical protein
MDGQLELFDFPKASVLDKTMALLTAIRRWQPLIDDALHHAMYGYSFDDIVMMIMRGELHFFDFPKCCVIMQPQASPGYRTYHCLVACGDMQAIKDTEPLMRENAKALNCKYMSISGRPGWARELKSAGWTHKFSALFKEV